MGVIIKLCQNYGVTADENREACPNCGARIYPAPSYDQAIKSYKYGNGALRTKEIEKKRNRTIGIVLILVGIILIPIAIFTFFMPIGWIFCPSAGICLLAGIITIATNLRKKEPKI